MINKPLEGIQFADIDRLVREKRPEGKTLDYKRDTYGGSDNDKKELLKDVSSFANTQGGDIMVGIDENNGVPIAMPGIAICDLEREKLRLEGIIRDGLEPRVELAIHSVATPSSTFILVIRVKESSLFPHRVVFHGKFGEFWARTSAGKYSMDTDELRRAFTLSESIYQQIQAFRRDRVSQVMTGAGPVPLSDGGKFILHLVPVASFRSRQLFDVAAMPLLPNWFPPIGQSGYDSRLNFDGVVSYRGAGQTLAFGLSYPVFSQRVR